MKKYLFSLFFILSYCLQLVAQAPVISYSTPPVYTMGTAITALTPTNTGGAVPSLNVVSTFAGSTSSASGSTDGTGTSALFYSPDCICRVGSNLYVCDKNNNQIRKIEISTGVVTTFAGSTTAGNVDAIGTAARFDNPLGICTDGTNLYVTETVSTIRKIVIATGAVSTLAGAYNSAGTTNGIGTNARFVNPFGICTDNTYLYVSDNVADVIRRIEISTGTVTTFAGSGSMGSTNAAGTLASFNSPYGICTDGTNLYVVEGSNNGIRKINISSKLVSLFAGSPAGVSGSADGTGTSARFNKPIRVCTDNTNLYVSDKNNNMIRKVVIATGEVTTLAGSTTSGAADGMGTAASFSSPYGACIDGTDLYVADYANNSIRKLALYYGGYSVSPALPAGLSLNTTTGVISGTPTAVTASTQYSISVVNVAATVQKSVTIQVNDIAPTSLTYATPPVFVKGTPITNLSPTNTGGTIVSYSISPALPTGLNFSTSTGVISGTPTVVSASTVYTVTGTNTGGSTTKAVTIQVNDIAPASLTYATPPVFVKGTPITNLSPTNTGGTIVSYSISPALPATLNFSTSTGVISGTPTVVSASTVYTVTGTNTGGSTTKAVTIQVNDIAPTGLTYTTPNIFVKGTGAGISPTNTGGTIVSYSISPALPTGLSISASTGIISGTPTAVSASTVYTVTGTNTGGSATKAVTIQVNDIAPTSLTYTTPNILVKGTNASISSTNTGGTIVSYSISPALPTGLSIDAATGIISGTPTDVAASTVYTVTGTNTGGNTTKAVTIQVNDIAPTSLIYATPNIFVKGTNAGLSPTNTGGTIVSYSISPALPASLSIDAATGIISGTPTDVAASAVYTVTGTNTGGSTTSSVTITVNDIAPSGLSYTTPNTYTKNTAIPSLSPTVSGGTVVSYSVSPALPDGLTLDTSTGEISGTPTAITANATYTITATNTGGSTTKAIDIKVVDVIPSGLSYTTSNTFTKGTAITALAPTVSGGDVDSYSISPSLPTGLSLNTTTGVITGTPTVVSAGTVYTVTATNTGGSTTSSVTITVNDIAPSGLSYTTPNTYTKNTAIPSLSPTVSGGTVVSYSISPALPAGLSLNTTTGVITGTPTVVSASTVYTVTATNTGGSTTSSVTITVNDIAPSGLSYTTPNTYTKNTAIPSLSPTVSGGTVLSYSISPALPAGLSLNTTTGVITGTPTVVSASTVYTVTATNTGGSTTSSVTITVNDIAPSGLSYTTPNTYTKNTAIPSLSPTVSGGTVLSYSISPALPAGLSLNTTTGVITGTPTVVSASATYTITATNSGGSTTYDVTIAVNDIAPAFSYTSPNTYINGTAIADLVPTNTGGTVISYSVSPALPAGLSLNTATGVITGTPTVVSASTVYTVTATNTGGSTTSSVTITVNDIAPSGLSYTTPNTYTKNTAIPSLSPTVSGGTVVSYSISPALPAGLSLNTTTGVITGTPTVVSASTVYTVTATNTGGSTTSSVTITVNDIAPSGLSYTTPNTYTKNTAIPSLSPTVSGGTVLSYSISPALPAGLSLNTTTGVITGTPTVVSASTVYTVTATNTGGSTTSSVTITVNDIAPSGLSYTTPNTYTKNTAIPSLSPTVSGGTVLSYSISPALPAGLSLNTTTGVITGTPTVVSASATYTITATNSGGSTTYDVTIAVNDIAPAFSYTSPNTYINGTAIADLVPTNTGGTVISYSVSPALPAGLSLNTATGVITGTPTVVSAGTVYTVTATNTGGSTTSSVTITVNDIAPSGLSYTTPNTYTKNTAIPSLSPTVSGGTVLSYSISPALPAGLSLNTTTGVITGTPTVVSASTVYTVTATNTGGSTTSSVTITVNDIAPSGLSYTTPNTYTKNTAIPSLSPTVSGGTVLSYSISPALPAGLSLNTTTGVITGTPTVVSASTVYTVTATNTGGSTTSSVTITVNDIAPSGLSYTTPNTYTKNTAIPSLSPTVSGGTVVSYSVSPALPAGLSLNTATGVITGTPTVVSASVTYTITATNSGGSTTYDVTIAVNDIAPAFSYTSPNTYINGTAIADLVPTNTGGTVISYSVSPALPAGLSLNTTTGVITGTPTSVIASASYTITATNTGGSTTSSVTITVNDIAPAFSYTSPNTFTKGTAITALTPTVNGGAMDSYNISPTLPDGLSLDTNTGEISGTPTTVSASTVYTVTATNSGGSAIYDITITVNDIAPSGLSYTTPNTYTKNTAIPSLSPTVSGGTVVSYSISPALPAGLSLNTTTGVITGTPTVVSASTVYTVTATNTGGSTTSSVTITVNDIAPSGLSYTTPNTYTKNTAIPSLSPAVSGGTVVSYSVSPALPAGLSLNTATGVITGTPTVVSASATYTITATNSGGSTTYDVTIAVNDIAPAFSYTSPNTYINGTAIADLVPTNTSGTVISYSVSPALPAGLSIDASTGVISGTPTAVSASATYTITATNSGGSATYDVTITVNDIAPAFSYTTPNTYINGTAISDLAPTNTGGTVVSYSVSPALPVGLSIDAATGVISGTPTAITAGASYTVSATNTGGSTTSSVTITVNDIAPAFSYTTPNTYINGTAIADLAPTNTGGTVVSYSVFPDLPAGLSLDAATGVISGTPTAITAGASYTVSATNTGGSTTSSVTITVNDIAPAFSYTTPNTFINGTAIADLAPANTGGTVVSYSVFPDLPAGLSLDAATGVISGTTTAVSASGVYSVTASNSGGSTTYDVTIAVNDIAPAFSYTTPNTYINGTAIADLVPTNTGGTVISYSVSPALPAGLSIDASTGVISGTPTTVSASATYTITATNSGGSANYDVTITVNDFAPAFSYTTPNTYINGTAIIDLSPTNTGGTVISYSVSPALPMGLSIDAATGIISGTPTAITAGASYTVSATNTGGSTTSSVTITVNDIAPAFSYTTPNTFINGTAITDLSPTNTGGTVVSYSVFPDLPAGLSIDAATGVISGTPTAITASAVYTVTAVNTGGNATYDVTIVVNDIAPAFSYTTPNTFINGTAIADLAPANTGGTVISYSVSPALPVGLSLNTSTGIINGTPTVVAASTVYTVTATNSGGSATYDMTIAVNDIAPAFSYATPNTFINGTAITDLSPTNRGGTVVSYSVSPALPAGLSIDPATGVISGTPTAVSASAVYTVTATNSGGSATYDVTIAVNDIAPAFSYTTPNNYINGTAIADLAPTNTGGAVISYSVSPALPAGLSLNTSTGIISGTPTAVAASAAYTVTGTNSGGSATYDVTIAVNDIAPLISYASPNTFTKNTPITNLSPTVSGGTVASYVVSPALPAGLSIDAATGIISGTPTAITASAVYTVTAANTGGSATYDVTITVNDIAPAFSYTSPNTYINGTAIADLVPTNTSGTVISYSVSPALPAGLSIDASTGVISGTPTAVSASATYTITATNSGGSATYDVTITVNDIAPAFSYTTPNTYINGTAISDLAPANTGGTVVSYSVFPDLPAGLSLDAAIGVISGTTTAVSASGVYSVTASNSGGSTTYDVTIVVNDIAPAFSYTTPNTFINGTAIADLAPANTGGTVISYSVSPALPVGLSLNTSTGIINGTPTAVAASTVYTVTATNSGGSATYDMTIAVNDIAPAFSYATPNTFINGTAITDLSPTNTGGTVVSYSVSPALPAGLSIDPATGVISSTPTAVSASAVYTVTATNSGGSATYDVTIAVNDIAPAFSYSTPNSFSKGTAISALTPTVSGGTVVSYSISPALPAGLSMDTNTGEISGTPTAITANATYTITATNTGGSITKAIDIKVVDVIPSGLTYTTPNTFTKGTAITALTPTVSGGAVDSYSISPTLPDGLSLDTSTGEISGTPTAVSASSLYTVTAGNSGGSTTYDVTIVVNDIAPAFSYTTPNTFINGTAIADLAPANTGGAVLSYSVSPALPAGFSIDAATGIISGTPTAVSASASYTVTATNTGGSASYDITINVNNSSVIAGDLNGDGTIDGTELAGDTNGDGKIDNAEILGDTNGDSKIDNGEIAGDANGDGTISTSETAGNTGNTGTPVIAGDLNGDGTIDGTELAGDRNGDGKIDNVENLGDTNGDGKIDNNEIAGDANGDGTISTGETAGNTGTTIIAGDLNGDGKITAPEIAGDSNGDSKIDNGETLGDTNGDNKIDNGEISGDANGDGTISTGETAGNTGTTIIAGDLNGDGKITAPEIAGDINKDGKIDNGETQGDTNGDNKIDNGEISGDANGDGTISTGETAGNTGNIGTAIIVGDTNGDGTIDGTEIAGDTNGDGKINNGEILGDTNGDGKIGGTEIAGDANGDSAISTGETAGNTGNIGTAIIVGDTNGDGTIDGTEIAGDTNGDGKINNGEILGDTNGDGKIGGTEIAGDANGDSAISTGETAGNTGNIGTAIIVGDTNGDGTIDGTELAGDTNGDGKIDNSEIQGDTNGDGKIGGTEIAGDANGDGTISTGETAGNTGNTGTTIIAGDLNGDSKITAPEIAGDTNGDGKIDNSEILGDTNGDGKIGGTEIAGDANGDSAISTGETAGNTGNISTAIIVGDTNGDGTIDGTELAGDTNGDGKIDNSEILGDTNGDGKIGGPEIAGDANGDGKINNAEVDGTVITVSSLSTSDNPVVGCDNSILDLPYSLLSGTPAQYKITFDAAALAAGLKNVAYTDLPSATASTVVFTIPEGIADGIYHGTMQLRNSAQESAPYPFEFTINLSSSYIIQKFDDVILIDNSSNRFTGYQWFKDGVAIAGATDQFYTDSKGLVGSYSVELITIDGQKLNSCDKSFNTPVSKNVKAYPNPAKINQDISVQMTGFDNSELKNAKLTIFDTNGNLVYHSDKVDSTNSFQLTSIQGIYIGHVTTATGANYSFKVIVIK